MPTCRLIGMWGFGDCLHQRAIVRELMKQHQVWLDTCHFSMYQDLVDEGLRLVLRPTSLRAQAKTIARERHLFTHGAPPIGSARTMRYNREGTDKHGSILAAMFATAQVPIPEKPDFSLPIAQAWIDNIETLMEAWPLLGKPLLVYRPIVLRKEWNQSQRNPDPACYAALYQSIRQKFFVVSIANLEPRFEWIDGPEQDADIKLHHGELDFPTMAALFKLADMVMSPAGYGPVLAQAVGTPVVVVYGCREDFYITERIGSHLAPTLGIDIDEPKRCLSVASGCFNKCKKHITLASAMTRIEKFMEEYVGSGRP